jgi:hypothetical protein
MSTLDPLASAVHHIGISDSPLRAAEATTGGSVQPVVVIVVLLAVMLVGGALKQLGRAFAPVGELLRLVLSALAVAVLLIGAIAVLIGGLILSARGN